METKKGYLFCFCVDFMVLSAIETEKEVKKRISLLYLSSFRRKKGWRKGGGRVEEGRGSRGVFVSVIAKNS